MKVNQNQTALDVTFDLSGSLSGYTRLLLQLPVGERIGFDTLPTFGLVSDIGQTWTPDIQGLEQTVYMYPYNNVAMAKAPYGTNLDAIQIAIDWGNDILSSLFERDEWVEFPVTVEPVSEELKHYVNFNQTIVDTSFDLSGSLAGVQALLEALPVGDVVGFDNLPFIYTVVEDIGQTWTPLVQDQSFEFPTLPMYNVQAAQKARYGTPLDLIQRAIDWGNDFLADITGNYAVDEIYDFAVDENYNYSTT